MIRHTVCELFTFNWTPFRWVSHPSTSVKPSYEQASQAQNNWCYSMNRWTFGAITWPYNRFRSVESEGVPCAIRPPHIEPNKIYYNFLHFNSTIKFYGKKNDYVANLNVIENLWVVFSSFPFQHNSKKSMHDRRFNVLQYNFHALP